MFEYKTVERPYPGLRPFEPWETEIFFGRDIHIDRLQDILKRQHFLTVTGPSGSGKSSLVRAGLLPALPLGAIGTGNEWRAAILRPGDKPLASLIDELFDGFALGPELDKLAAKNENATSSLINVIEAELRRGPRGLVDLITDLRRHADDPNFNLLILVDQFEEIFTYAEANVQQADESDIFVNLLLAAAKATEANIFVVITMRTDFLGACTRFQDLPETINRSLYLTPRLNREQLTEAIAGPAKLYGLDLPAELVAEYVNAGQNDPDQLPVLQHALARRWDQSCEIADAPAANDGAPAAESLFDTVGDLGKALSEHADVVYQNLTEPQRVDAQWLFRAITEKRSAELGGQMVRQPKALAVIEKWSGRPWTNFIPILNKFADPKVSFLTYKGQPGEPENGENTVIDISHEAVMRQWQNLKQWVENEGHAAQQFREWRQRAERKESGDGAYLSGADLTRAQNWLAQGLEFVAPSTGASTPDSAPNGAWAQRYCAFIENGAEQFELVEKFILQSRDATRFLRRFMVLLAALVVLACMVTAWFGYDRYQQSLDSDAKSLWFPLLNQKDLATGIGADYLDNVAQEDSATRNRFIEEIMQEEDLAVCFLNENELLLRASIQSNLKLRGDFVSRMKATQITVKGSMLVGRTLSLCRLGEDLEVATILSAISITQSPSYIGFLKECVVSNLLKEKQIEIVEDVESLTKAFLKTQDSDQLKALSDALKDLGNKLNNVQAAAVLPLMVEMLRKTNDPFQLQTLGGSLTNLAGKLSDAQASAILPDIVEVTQKTNDSDQLQALSKALAGLVGKLTNEQVITLVRHYGQEVQKANDYYQLQALGEALSGLSGKLTAEQAAAILPEFVTAVQKATDSNQLFALGDALAGMTGQLNGAQETTVLQGLVEAVQKTADPNQLNALGKALAGMKGKINGAQETTVVHGLVEAVLKTADPNQLDALGKALAGTAGKLKEVQAVVVLQSLVEAVQKTADSNQLFALGKALVALGDKLSDDQASALVSLYAREAQKNIDSSKGETLTELADKLNGKQASAVIPGLVKAIQNTTDYYQLQALGNTLAVLETKLTDAQADVVLPGLVEAFQNTTNSYQIQALSEALAGLANKFNDVQARTIVSHYTQMVRKTTDYFQIKTLRDGVKDVSAKLVNAQAVIVLSDVIDVIKKTSNSYQFEALSALMADLAGNLNNTKLISVLPDSVDLVQKITDTETLRVFGSVLGRVADKLNDTQTKTVVDYYSQEIQKINGYSELQNLGKVLAELTGKLNGVQAGAVLPQMIQDVQKTTDVDQFLALSSGLAGLAGRLNDAQTWEILNSYTQAVQQTTDPIQLQAFGKAAAWVASNLEGSQVMSVLPALIDAIRKTNNSYQLKAFGEALTGLVGTQDGAQASGVLPILIKAVNTTVNSNQLETFELALMGLTDKLNSAQVGDILDQTTYVMQITNDFSQLQSLGEALAGLAGNLSKTNAEIAASRLIWALKNSPDGARKAALSSAANAVIPHVDMKPEQARNWLQISNVPFIDRDAVAAAIRKQYPDAPPEEQGIWAFLQWANPYFEVNRPAADELLQTNLEVLALPLSVLAVGVWLLIRISGRRLVAIQLKKLPDKKDRIGLGLRLQGYSAQQVKTHWGVLGADERIIEQRYLWMDQVFAPFYGGAFYYALQKGSYYLSDPLPPAILTVLVCLTVIADWVENTIQLRQLGRLERVKNADPQARWIRLASLATQIKLLGILSALAILTYFSVRMTFF